MADCHCELYALPSTLPLMDYLEYIKLHRLRYCLPIFKSLTKPIEFTFQGMLQRVVDTPISDCSSSSSRETEAVWIVLTFKINSSGSTPTMQLRRYREVDYDDIVNSSCLSFWQKYKQAPDLLFD